MERPDRRQILKLGLALAARRSFPAIFPNSNPTLGDVFGLHFNPTGSMAIDQELKMSQVLNATSCTVINPDPALLAQITTRRMRHPVVRPHYQPPPGQEFNEVDATDFIDAQTAQAVRILGAGALIQPYNEPDEEGDIDHQPISAKTFTLKRLIPAIEIINHRAGSTIITPLADESFGRRKADYLYEMLTTLRDNLAPSLSHQLIFGAHPYYCSPGDQPIKRALEERQLAQDLLGVDIPIAMPEFGIQQDLHGPLSLEQVSQQTLQLLRTPITAEDKVICCNLWITSVLADVDLENTPPEQLGIWQKFERAALRRRNGQLHPLYYALKAERQFLAPIAL